MPDMSLLLGVVAIGRNEGDRLKRCLRSVPATVTVALLTAPLLIAGEEPELCQRLRVLGWQIWRLDAPMTVHDANMHRFGQFWNRAIRSGFGYAQVNYKTKASSGDELYKREVGSALIWTVGLGVDRYDADRFIRDCRAVSGFSDLDNAVAQADL